MHRAFFLAALPLLLGAKGSSSPQNAQAPPGNPPLSTCEAPTAARLLAAEDFLGAIEACALHLAPPQGPPAPGESPTQASASDAPASEGPAEAVVAEPTTGGGETPTSFACRLIAARSFLALGRPAEAVGILLPARASLDAWGLLLLAEARLRAGEKEEVPPLLGAAVSGAGGGPVERRAEVLRLRLQAESADPAQAVEALQRLLEGKPPDAAELHLRLAARLLAAGRTQEAIRHYLQVWTEHPDHAAAGEAAAALARLEAAIPLEQRLGRAEGLLARGQAARARDELEAIAAPERPEPALLLLRARAWADSGARDRAEALLVEGIEALPPDQRRDPLVLAARMAARRGDVDAAIAHLDRSGGRFDDAFLAAFLLYDFGRFDEAAARFRELQRSGGRRGDEVLWYLAWLQLRSGDAKGAEASLDRLLARYPKSSLVPQASYWKARAVEAQGRPAAALYQAVRRRWPTHWYALLAATRLEAKETAAGAVPHPRPTSPKSLPPGFERARRLYCLGFQAEAAEELEAALRGQGRAALELATRVAAEGGDAHRAFRLATRWSSGATPDLYPKAFPHAVERVAAASGLSPYLLWSLMRQESAFNPTARSPRAAQGLLQLLPTTAARLVGNGSQPRLFDPETNVGLGATYLAALLQRFDGNLPLAVAAYNAGPQAVVGWLRDPLRATLPLDEFVESIPWRETRNYVKIVMGNLASYHRVYGEAPPSVPMALPTVREGIDY